MTNKTISKTVHGYTFAASNTNLTITATGKITGKSPAAVYAASNRANETILNLGTVGDANYLYGVLMKDGATITNGSATDKTAAITGSSIGIRIDGKPGNVTNFGTIHADQKAVAMFAGGTVTNGSAADTTARISAQSSEYEAIHINYGVGKVTNFGAITGEVDLIGGGVITNQASGRINGLTAIYLVGGTLTNTTLKNLGTITGHVLVGTGNIINGSATDRTATISVNSQGVSLETGTITNYGTITATSDVLAADTDTIIVEAGSKLIGAASYAQNATLVFGAGGGAGTITGLGTGTITGSTSGKFRELTQYEIQAGGTWTLSGADSVVAGDSLKIGGTLALASTLGGTGNVSIAGAGILESGAASSEVKTAVVNSGLLVAGANQTLKLDKGVTGGGSAKINGGGTLFAAAAFKEAVKFNGSTGKLELAQSRTYTGTVTGFSKTGGASLDLRDIKFVSASEAQFTGAATGGTLTVSDGTHTAKIKLAGNYTGVTFKASSDGSGGTTVVAHTPASAPHFIAAMATMGAAAGGTASPGRETPPTPPLLAHPRA